MYKYVHGGDIYSERDAADDRKLIDFSANINPLGMPIGVKKALHSAIKDCADYPDPFCRQLTTKLAKYHNVKKEDIFLSNGAAAVLFRLALAIRPKQALLLAPTFADYEKALATVNCQVNYYNLEEQKEFQVNEDILTKITETTDLVIICNPNNPTGQLTGETLLLKIIDRCQMTGAKLLVDECFMDFVDEEKAFSLTKYLPKYKNLIILKAFTKIYAMAGVRLGYCLTEDMALIEACRENGQDWSVSTLAQAAGISALDDADYLEKTKVYIKKERAYLLENLANLNVKTFGSTANYVFFSLEQVTDFAEKLRKEGIIIRQCSNYNNLNKHYYRIAVRTKSQNRIFIKVLREILKNENTISNN